MSKFANLMNILHGIIAFFISVFAVRVTYPIFSTIWDMQEAGVIKAVMILIVWAVFFFVIYMTTYHFMFEPQEAKEVIR